MKTSMMINEIRSEISNFSFNDYYRHLKEVEEASSAVSLKPVKIAVLRSYTVEMIEPVLKLRLFLEGYKPEFFFGDYNLFFQEILSPDSALYDFEPDVIMVLMRLEELLPDFVEDFGGKSFQEWEAGIRDRVEQLIGLVDEVEKRIPAQLLFQSLAPPEYPYFGIYDIQNAEGQICLVHTFNRLFAEALGKRGGAFLWDFNGFLQKHGYSTIVDPKMWYVARSPFKQSVYPLMVDDLMKYLLSMMGRVKKCIVLDLDNTLWGGVAGEDGMDGIALGHEYPGRCYLDFQKGLLKLYHRGVILAINSKNNEADAFEIIDNHPDMALRRKHFAAWRINWNDKVSNMKSLAADLNIGIESMIFIDDSPVECELFRQRCPECQTVCLPQKPYLIPGVLNSLTGLENIKLTDEDRKKGAMYQAQVARKQSSRSFENLEDFLKSLEMQVTIKTIDSFSLSRISQLTQKTNQMNLTTRRYTEANIQAFDNPPESYVFSVSARDRFGDNGIIGVFILRIDGEECLIDTFLLSCRVIGRNIEQSMIAFIAAFASERGARYLIGEYLATAKNKPAADMYEKFGFIKISDNLFRADLSSQGFEYPTFITHFLPSL